MRLPDGSGQELIELIAENYPDTPVAMITAYGNVDAAVNALKAGAFDFVSKPVDIKMLRSLVQTALSLSEENAQQREQPGPPMRQPPDRILRGHAAGAHHHRQARAQPGAGLHQRRIGRRQGTGRAPDPRTGPARRRAVRAGQLRRDPVRADGKRVLRPQEGQLHRRRTPTRKACSRPRNGGTLFLDEVAELPLHMQVKLLRVIQEKAVRPIGGRGEVPVDVRILSATHKNLAELVEQGQFPPGPVLPHQRDRTARPAAARASARTCRELAESSSNAWPARAAKQPVTLDDQAAGRALRSLQLPRQRARAGKHPRARPGHVRGRHRAAGRPDAARARPGRAQSSRRPTARRSGRRRPPRRRTTATSRWTTTSPTSSARRSSRRWKNRATTRPPPRASSASPSARCATS